MKREICVELRRKSIFFAKSIRAAAAAINFSSPVKNEICSLAHVQKHPFDICIIFLRSLFIYPVCREGGRRVHCCRRRRMHGIVAFARSRGRANCNYSTSKALFNALSHREALQEICVAQIKSGAVEKKHALSTGRRSNRRKVNGF